MNFEALWAKVIYLSENTESLRLLATIAVIGVCVFISRALENSLHRKANEQATTGEPLDKARKRFVHMKNLVWVTSVLIVFTIWASKIAGIILSLAAVAGASLIVSKELLMCLLGYGYLMASRAYQVGDYIEVNHLRGRVVDIDIFATTLAENSLANQLTGKTLTMPNGMLLSHSVRNISATGDYIINMVQLFLPVETDIELAESVALKACQDVNGAWQVAVNKHLAKLEMRNLVDVPTARPKALWMPVDSKTHSLVIRYGCPVSQRVNSEQEFFRKFWTEYNKVILAKEAAKALWAPLPAILPASYPVHRP